MKRPLRLGVLGSGKGSNFRAIMEQIVDGRLDAEVRIVISDVDNSGILSLAREFQIPGLYLRPGRFRTKLEPEIEEDMVRLLLEEDVELVVLAGFMRIVKAASPARFSAKDHQHSPFVAAKVPRIGSMEAGSGGRRESDRMHGALCRRGGRRGRNPGAGNRSDTSR